KLAKPSLASQAWLLVQTQAMQGPSIASEPGQPSRRAPSKAKTPKGQAKKPKLWLPQSDPSEQSD
ncbi:MAG: hypothetical protein VX026_13715, partial [Myxococcota bacterium]|nr:hypothetical protein [Myxococcota bacterium]